MGIHAAMRMRSLALAAFCLSISAGVACRSHDDRPSNTLESASSQKPSTRPAVQTVRSTTSTWPTTRAAPSRTSDLREIVEYLASDGLEGRGVGTRGLDLAAEYIAEHFKSAGLAPAFGQSYFQPFEMTISAAIGEATSLAAGNHAYKLREHFIPIGYSTNGAFKQAPVVFVGYGISSTRFGYDDYAGIDVHGKVALALRFEPHNAQGKSRFGGETFSDEATLSRKAKAAREAGAIALLLANPVTYHGEDALMPFVGQYEDMTGQGSLPFIQITQEVAASMLKRSGGDDLEALQAKIDTSGKPASFELRGVTVSGRVDLRRERANVRNVGGLLRGSGPLADEYVVVGAHYDHLGWGGAGSLGPQRRDIHNGADDNASGTACLIALAERLAARPNRPETRRSILFVAFTAEERGLVGSRYLVEYPPVPLDRVAAMVNLDMVGRARDDTLLIGGAGTAAAFEEILTAADDASSLTFKEIDRNGIGPSDHMTFLMKKIPVLFFFTGLHDDYHRPTDDVEKLNLPGLSQVLAVAEQVVGRIATIPRPSFIESADGRSSSLESRPTRGSNDKVSD